MKLRTKLLISVAAILIASRWMTLFVVRRACETQTRQVLLNDLRGSILTFETFERDREENLGHVSHLLASLPSLRALMTTSDAVTIQDASADIWRELGSDLFVLSDRDANVMAAQALRSDLSPRVIEEALQTSLRTPRSRSWAVIGGHLYETFSQPLYFASRSDAHLLGVLTVGYEINDRVAKEVADIAASEVAFQYGDAIFATTVPRSQEAQIASIPSAAVAGEVSPFEISVANERFASTYLVLANNPVPVRLIVLKSFDKASSYLGTVTRILSIISMVLFAVGCGLVFLLFRRFTQPLDSLMAGVRALEQQDFSYPLASDKKDELADLTRAFDHMRASLLAAQEKLVTSERLATIGMMASCISHDLRHRLTAVIGNAEFLADDRLKSNQRQELYGEVRSAVTRMTEMLESLQEFSRTPESLRVELTALNDILQDAVASVRLHPEYQKVAIIIHSDRHISGWFDPCRLERMFYNLLMNACEMVPKIAGKVEVFIHQIGPAVEIRISDNGPGIPPPILHDLFRPFASYGKHNGSGLGLAICDKTCRDHGGEIVLEDAAPGCTTFKINLPIDMPERSVIVAPCDGFTEIGTT